MPQYSPTFQVICSDVRKGLSRLNDSSVDTVVTSPPYYGQRDYESDIQIGHEKTIEDYVDTLVEIFGAVRRVLRPEGTLWLNLGDKYLNGQLQGLPWRVALALQADGWVLRSDIIWHKPNAMPSAVKNRPTTDHE
ncbi:MAG: site-specific DNA-methyltransferase, partial [Pirellulaceae bacterium]|nr:site-specific DNA-methyltransferase [Pirellulaceae bacterium]